MKFRFRKILFVPLVLSTLLVLPAVPAAAATTDVTGGTNGSSCNSGGYFTPSSVTINSGDTITFSVPSNDPYAGGMEIIGFPQGNIIIARGGSVTTSPITVNVSYHGTWPSAPSCLKGSGTVTVSTPASPPPSGGSTGSTGGSTSSSTTPTTTSTPAKSSTNTSNSTSQPTTTEPTTTAPTTQSTPSSTSTKKGQSSDHSGSSSGGTTVAGTDGKKPALANVATLGGGGLAVIAIGLFIAWRMLARRRLRTVPEQPSTIQPQDTPAATPEAARPVEPSQAQTSGGPHSENDGQGQGDGQSQA